jgi:phage terminase small subunit
MPALTVAKEEMFAQSYARTGSSRQAAIDCDLGIQTAYGWLKRPHIQKRIDEMITRRFARAEITAERVMTELARIAFADPRDLYDDKGDLLPVHLLSDDAAAVLAEIKVELKLTGRGDQASVVELKNIKIADKMAALSLLAKHFKLVGEDSDGVNALANALSARLNEARKRDQAYARANAAQGVMDATIVERTGKTTYAVEDDPSPEFRLERPRELDTPDPTDLQSPMGHGLPPIHDQEPDDEDLAD